MLDSKVVTQLAQMIYTGIEGGAIPWDKLDEEKRDEQKKKATAIIETMGKLNLSVLTRAEVTVMKGGPAVDQAAFKLYCNNFMKEVDPKSLISKLFPMDELEARLRRDFDIRVRP